MKKIKMMLALLAALVCGGAWAISLEQAAVYWDRDFTTAKAGYTLSAGGTTAITAEKITIGNTAATIEFDTAFPSYYTTVIVRFKSFTATSGNQALMTLGCAADNNRMGVYASSESKLGGIQSGGATWGSLSNLGTMPSDDNTHTMVLRYKNTAKGDDTNRGTYFYVDGTQLYGASGLVYNSGNDYIKRVTIGGEYSATTVGTAANLEITGIAIYNKLLTDTEIQNFIWPSYVGDAAVWSNLDSTASAATPFSRGTGNLTFHLNPTAACPKDSQVAISTIKIANGAQTMADTMTINGIVGTKQSETESFTSKSTNLHGTTIDRLFTYTFETPVVVVVDRDYPITMNSSGLSGVLDQNSPIRIGGLSGTYANHNGYCSVEGVIRSFPTLPDTISYTAGDPSNWQSTGVGVAVKDADAFLKEIANRYSFAATFGSTSMDASPRDGTPLNVTLHSDGVLTVEMQVTNGGFKKAALVGFTVDGGFLKVKRIKSTYANTSFNGPMMTYANGNVTKASDVNDGSYILANVTLTRITKFKDDAVEPDFLSTTAPSIRYDASKYDNFTYNENGEVQSWKDLSANNNNATPAETKSGNTMVTRYGRVEIVNGVPAFQMGDVGSGIDLGFTRQTNIRTVFWVMDIKQDYGAFFLGDVGNSCYDFHRGQNGVYASENKPFKNARNVRCDGATVNQSSDVVPTGLHVFSAKLASNASANRLSQDRDINNRNGGRAISELVIFNSELTDDQIAAMNKYLMKKWMGIETGEVSATLSEGSQNFSTITWDEGGEFANGKDVTLTVNATTTLTIDNETLIGSLTLTGAGTLTVNSAQNLTFGEIDISGFTGTINYNVDATRASFTADNALKTFIKNAANKVVFTFTGSGSNGATVDFGGNELNSNPDIGGRLIFSGGMHTLQICHGNVDSGKGSLATGGTIDAPSILATNNATLTYKMKDMCGWNGDYDAGSTVKVDAGSKIKLSHNQSNHSMFMRGRLVVVPGGELEIDPTSNDNVLAIYGGDKASTDNTNAQIYVPAPAQGAENTVAKITVASGATRTPIKFHGASAITVEEGATLDISASVKGTAVITKYGDGILRMPNRSDYTGTITVTAGYLDVGEMRDFSSLSGITVSGTGGFLIRETSVEYAKADLTVTNPNNYTIKVVRPNGPTVYDLATVVDDTTIKISGAATSFDVTFNTKDTSKYDGHIDYQSLDYVRLQYDSVPSYINETTTPGSKTMGVYLKHHPYVHNLENNNDAWFKSTDEITLAVVGQMPSTQNTVFLHMGRSGTKNGLFLATGDADEEVKICYNKNWAVEVIDTLKVPNASSARHTYVITKHDDPEGTENRQTTFEIWLDGELINTKKFDHFIVTGGIQVGKPYGDSFSGWNNVGDSDSTSYINLIRVYDRVISEAEILKYSDSAEYPYNSPQGTYQRNFTTAAGQMWKGADNAWTSSVEGEESGVALPLKGLVTANFAGATTITVNQTEATSYEKLILNGASDGDSTITFEKGEGAVVQISTLNTTINTPVVIKEGALDLSGGPTKISAHGHVTFDYSSLTAQDVLTDDDGAASFKVTGLTQATADQFTLIKPTDARLDVSLVKHNDNNSYYVEATVKPVYLNNDNTFKLADGTAVATLLDGDKVIVSSVGYNGNQRWQVNLNNAALTGHTVVIDYPNGGTNPGVTIYSDIYDGVDIEILEGSKMYMTSNKSVWATSVSGDGTFSLGNTLYLHKTLTVTCAVTTTDSGNFCLESDSVLNVPANSTVKVTAYSGNTGYVKKTTAANVDTYTFVAGTQEIAPAEGEDTEPVVIEDVGTGIIVNPGAEVEVKLPENATQEQLTTIAGKISVRYTLPGSGTVKDLKTEGLVTVAVNPTTGAVELTTTDSAKPAETDIVMAATTDTTGETPVDEVAFTITNPIPGLFYAVSSCDTPDGTFESATGDQATSSAAKTVSIPMTFTDGKKVKYYKVSVKATK